MLASTLFLAGALVASAFASPILQAKDNTWTLQGFVRTCDDIENDCHYQYTIHDNSNGQSTACDYWDYIEDGGSGSARENSYQNKPCNSDDSPFYINQGYDASGFITLVPVDRATNIYAFFGYSNSEMVDGQVVTPDHTSTFMTVGTFREKRQSPGWSITGMTRNCDGNSCTYSFNIDVGSGSAHCGLSIAGPATQSFYSVSCMGDSNWVISWGYNSEYGFAVMTVVSVSAQEDAWFGYNNVNSQTTFPDQGPNQVYPL